jgi:hypothetical protein
MIESINKNTDVVGVSDALKQLATKKQSPVNNPLPPPLVKQNQIDDETLMDNKVTMTPSHDEPTGDCEAGKAGDEPTQTCGWFGFRPKFLQRFMNPHYALAFLCLAGAIQGNCVNHFCFIA